MTSQLTTSYLFELAPGEESVLVEVKPPEGLLHPVQPGPLLLLLGPRPPVLARAGAGGQATQEAVLKTGPLERVRIYWRKFNLPPSGRGHWVG